MIKTCIIKVEIVLALMVLLASCNNAYSGDEQEYHFRHTRWGMSREDVRKAENGEPESAFSQGDTLAWKAELLGEPVLVVYGFAFNKLVRTKYMFAKYSPAMQTTLFKCSPQMKPLQGEFILDFGKFKKALIEKYGKPEDTYMGAPMEVQEDKNYELEATDNTITMIEEAISTSKTAWYSAWKTKDTSIILLLSGKLGRMTFEIGYSSVTLSHLLKKAPL